MNNEQIAVVGFRNTQQANEYEELLIKRDAYYTRHGRAFLISARQGWRHFWSTCVSGTIAERASIQQACPV